jgi:radical SAM protein with 4Fe4S-binding SPASM domain
MFYVNARSFANKLLNRAEIELGRTKLISHPVELTLEPTLECNSNCIMCNRNFNRQEVKQVKGFLSWETFDKVRPFFTTAERVLFGGFGEPLMHPDYLKMLKEIKQAGSYVYVFTNGILMTEKVGRALVDEGMDMICISMGGATRETYQKIRGVDAFDTVVDNIRSVAEYKINRGTNLPLLSFNIVAMRSLLQEMDAIVELAHTVGVGHIAMPNLVAQGPEMERESLWLCRDEALAVLSRAGARAAQYGITFVPPNFAIGQGRCNALFNRLNINWDGSIMSCAMERYIAGELSKQTIAEIWNSKSMKGLRRKVIEDGFEAICPKCTCWDNEPENYLHPWNNSRAYAKEL